MHINQNDEKVSFSISVWSWKGKYKKNTRKLQSRNICHKFLWSGFSCLPATLFSRLKLTTNQNISVCDVVMCCVLLYIL